MWWASRTLCLISSPPPPHTPQTADVWWASRTLCLIPKSSKTNKGAGNLPLSQVRHIHAAIHDLLLPPPCVRGVIPGHAVALHTCHHAYLVSSCSLCGALAVQVCQGDSGVLTTLLCRCARATVVCSPRPSATSTVPPMEPSISSRTIGVCECVCVCASVCMCVCVLWGACAYLRVGLGGRGCQCMHVSCAVSACTVAAASHRCSPPYALMPPPRTP